VVRNQAISSELETHRENLAVRVIESEQADWDPASERIEATLEGLSRTARELWNPINKDALESLSIKVVSDAGKCAWYQRALNDASLDKQLEPVQDIQATLKALTRKYRPTDSAILNSATPYQKLTQERNTSVLNGLANGVEAVQALTRRTNNSEARAIRERQQAHVATMPALPERIDSAQEAVALIEAIEQAQGRAPLKSLRDACIAMERNGSLSREATSILATRWQQSNPLLPDDYLHKASALLIGAINTTRLDTLDASAAEHVRQAVTAILEYTQRRETAESRIDELLNESPALQAAFGRPGYKAIRERLVRALAGQKKQSPGKAPGP
jgi:hypothetical protein